MQAALVHAKKPSHILIAEHSYSARVWIPCIRHDTFKPPPLPLQIRLHERHVAGMDTFRTLHDPRMGLTVTRSRQQVLARMLEDVLACPHPPPPTAAEAAEPAPSLEAPDLR